MTLDYRWYKKEREEGEVDMDSNISYVTVKIKHKGDIDTIVADCDYEFEHDDIIDTEIIDANFMEVTKNE